MARALGIATGTRIEWDAYDLITSHGVKVEVKSAAYLQSWDQVKYSDISFSVVPTQAWDYKANKREGIRKRQADVYVFALLRHKHKLTLNPMDMKQWAFYVLPTIIIGREIGLTQGSITLSRLLSFGPRQASFDDLAQIIDGANPKQDDGEE